MTKKDENLAPAGWYPDTAGNLRYWNGSEWLNIPAPPNDNAEKGDSNHKLILGTDFRIEVGMSIFVGELNEDLDWPMSGDSVTAFCDVILKDSDFSKNICLKNTNSSQYGNPRIDPSHLNSYLWALGGVLFADYFEMGIEYKASAKNSKLDWNSFRKEFRNAQRKVFSSPSFVDNEYAPVDFFVNNLSWGDEDVWPQRELVDQLCDVLEKCSSNPQIQDFLSYFIEEIQQKDTLDEALIKFLWTEIVFSLPKLTGFDQESILAAINTDKSGQLEFEWSEPEQLPWLIEHNREISKKISYNPWPWTSMSQGLWNDDTDSFYAVERLESSQPLEKNPTAEQKIAALSSLSLFGDENESVVPEALNLFIEDNSDLIDVCFEVLEDEWTENENYSLPDKDVFVVSKKNSLIKRVEKVWPEYVGIIRED